MVKFYKTKNLDSYYLEMKEEKKTEYVRPKTPFFVPCFIPSKQVKKDMWKDYSYILKYHKGKKNLNIDYYKDWIQKMEHLTIRKDDFNNAINTIITWWWVIRWVY